ncbi:MAG: hypothetical protein ABI380_13585 [Edaphobacter sp.]
MNKVVVASLLAVASIAVGGRSVVAQAPENPGASAQSSGGVQMTPAEYKAYNDAISQTTPQAKAAALETYLTAYPQSAVKADTLQLLMITYSSFDPAKTLSTADRLLQVQPDNLRALTFEVYFRKQDADKATDPAAKQSALDAAAGFAQKGLTATKPKEMSDADFNKLKESVTPGFYGAIAADAANKKDMPTAITNYTSELKASPPAATTTPGLTLQDTYLLGLAYYQSTPPDYLNCTWFTSRAAAFAPEPYKSEFLKVATYCYKRYHGNSDGYDAITTAVQANLFPPPTLASTIKPAPSPADIVAQVIASTPDLAALAVSDKEFILQNGKPDDAAKVWDTIKGKSVQLPDVTVVSATDSAIQASVSDDAVASKTADFTFNLKEPLKTVPAPGTKVTLSGTYASYTVGGVTPAAAGTPAAATSAPAPAPAVTPEPGAAPAAAAPASTPAPAAPAVAGPAGPVMIVMSDSEVVEPKKAPAKKPAATHRRAAPRKR